MACLALQQVSCPDEGYQPLVGEIALETVQGKVDNTSQLVENAARDPQTPRSTKQALRAAGGAYGGLSFVIDFYDFKETWTEGPWGPYKAIGGVAAAALGSLAGLGGSVVLSMTYELDSTPSDSDLADTAALIDKLGNLEDLKGGSCFGYEQAPVQPTGWSFNGVDPSNCTQEIVTIPSYYT